MNKYEELYHPMIKRAKGSWEKYAPALGVGVGTAVGGASLYLLGRLIHGKKSSLPFIYSLIGATAGGVGGYSLTAPKNNKSEPSIQPSTAAASGASNDVVQPNDIPAYREVYDTEQAVGGSNDVVQPNRQNNIAEAAKKYDKLHYDATGAASIGGLYWARNKLRNQQPSVMVDITPGRNSAKSIASGAKGITGGTPSISSGHLPATTRGGALTSPAKLSVGPLGHSRSVLGTYAIGQIPAAVILSCGKVAKPRVVNWMAGSNDPYN